jgi:hypothetical protein
MYEIYIIPVALVCVLSSYAILKVCWTDKSEKIDEIDEIVEIDEKLDEVVEEIGKSFINQIKETYNAKHPNKRMEITFEKK